MNIIDRESGVEIKVSLALIDANGKELKVNISDITDIAPTFSSISDSSNMMEFSKIILDSDGNETKVEDLVKGIKSDSVLALDVTFEATHTGGNANHTVYTSDSMERDYQTWMTPFKKPLIKNHDMNEEPIGRVLESEFSQSEIVEDRDTINVTFRVSDKDSMIKFADNRYSTMSIGASCNTVTCNICGKNILKDNSFKFCGHWRGEKYKNEVATWTTKDLVYKEGSVVNNPADAYAQVKKIRAIKSKGGDKVSDNQVKNEDNIVKDVKGDIVDDISIVDSLIEDSVEEVVTAEDSLVEDNIENAQDSINIQDELNKANIRVKELEDENKELNDKITSLDSDLLDSQNSLSSIKDQAKALARINKKLLIDIAQSLSSTSEDFEGKSAKELSDMIEDLKIKNSSRANVAAPIKNPSATLVDSNVIEDNSTQQVEDNSKPTKTMKDFETIVNKLFK